MKRFAPLLIAIGLTFVSSSAWAWSFTCAPEETTVIGFEAPNVMMMLDRSGSMNDRDGIIPNTCKVCEVDGTRFEVASAADCPRGGTPWTLSDTASIPRNGSPASGYTLSYSFAVPPAQADIEVSIDVTADLNGSCEWADVFVDGDFVYKLSGLGQCSRRTRNFTIPSTYADDGVIDVEIVTSADGNNCDGHSASCVYYGNCDGVDTLCNTNEATVTLTHNTPIYWGSQAWDDPCGSSDKWEQAVSAIDAITTEAQNSNPEQVYFGLGLFNGTTARIEEDCRATNHDPIMSVLDNTGPSGNTPTARAIQTALNSDCVGGAGYTSVSAETFIPTDSSVTGYDLDMIVDNIDPGADVELDLTLYGDYQNSCEFARILVDGVDFGTMTDTTDCRNSGFMQTFTIPATFVDDGQLHIQVQTRGDGEVTSFPTNCGSGTDGVDAYCGTNGAHAEVRWLNTNRPPSATILITDGAPTVDINGNSGNSTTNYRDPIVEACTHRETAPMFVVGLGAGTDEDYNNILSAAGGTGECLVNGVPVDPCSNPSNWANLRNKCTGSIQASSGDALLTALAEITAGLTCTFNINFFNSGHSEVPADATNTYPYLYVDVYETATDSFVQVFNKNSALATPVGEGWAFPGDSRQFVKFSPYYCDKVKSYAYSQVTTHLACLCQEDTGSTCSVPDNVALGVCPEGNWACDEGVDWCQPDTNCCVAGTPCTIPGLLGVCAQGVTVCDTPTGSCQQVNFPAAEICDGEDNDCDGVVDEIDGACTVPGGIGRCAAGTRVCNGGNEQCVQKFQPMPELCNGLDDDCDGNTDNISVSWSKPQFQIYKPLSTNEQAAACRLLDVCMCPGGAKDDHAGADFTSYVSEWDPVCECGEGLAQSEGPAATWTDDGAAADAEPQGCASVDADADLAPLLLVAFVGLLRRRR